MKKIMFAAAAIAAGVAVAEGLVSSDIVGYAQNGLQEGATMVTPQFVPVAGSTLNLTELVPTGDETSDNVFIQTLDPYGRTVDEYGWNDWANDKACWVNDSYEPVTNVTFTTGQGLWVFGSTSTQGLQSAGKVGLNDIVVQLQNGATGTGNPFPVELNLNDIVPTGDDISDNVFIQTLDPYGRTLAEYGWNDWANDKACWVDDSYAPVTDVTFAPGQGLWIFGTSNAQYVQFPAPEL